MSEQINSGKYRTDITIIVIVEMRKKIESKANTKWLALNSVWYYHWYTWVGKWINGYDRGIEIDTCFVTPVFIVLHKECIQAAIFTVTHT